MSLSIHKMVYAHQDDPQNTIILRSFYPDSAYTLKRYEIRGEQEIQSMFLGILQLFRDEGKEIITAKNRFLSSVQVNAIFELVEEIGVEINQQDFKTIKKETSNSNIFNYVAVSKTDEVGFTTTKH